MWLKKVVICGIYLGWEMFDKCSVVFLVNGVVSLVSECVLLCMFIC